MTYSNLRASLLAIADEKPVSKTIFDKYREVQKSYKKLIGTIELAKDDPDPLLRKFETQARERVQKLGADIKAMIVKLENNAFVDPASKAKAIAVMDEVKSKFGKLKYQLSGQKVVVAEHKYQGLVICHTIVIKVASSGVETTILFCQPEYLRGKGEPKFGLLASLESAQNLVANKTTLVDWLEKSDEFSSVALSKSLAAKGISSTDKTVDLFIEAEKLLSTLSFRGQENSDKVSINSETHMARGFRVWDFFESRPHEEDDDNPTFVGKKDALAVVERHFSKILDKINIRLHADEKSWFTVEIELRPPAAPKGK